MKRICLPHVAVLVVCLLFAASSVQAVEVIGDPNAKVNGNFTATGNLWTTGVVGFNTGPTTDSTLRVKGNGGPSVFRMDSVLGNIVCVINDHSGDGALQLRDNTNSLKTYLKSAGVSYFNGGNVGIGTSTPTVPLDVNGEIACDVLQIRGGSDLSEAFQVDAKEHELKPGMVVSIDPKTPGALCVSTEAYDRKVAGVVSGAGDLNTGMIMGQKGSLAYGEHPIALTGRVYCYVDATEHGVTPGDMLTTSPKAGHAMKATDDSKATGAILGKAMTPLAKGETGLVLVLVGLQ